MLLKRKAGRHRRRGKQELECCCCRDKHAFCWRCRCGLQICQQCMYDNLWGMTCNNITWDCPDCDRTNSFGNQ